jgi:hypothetical protein
MTDQGQPSEPDSERNPRLPARVFGQAVDAGFTPAPSPAIPPAPTLLEELRPWAGPEAQRPTFSPPVFGALSVIFGITAFYKATLLLSPLALIAGLIACLKRQWGWGLIGILSGLTALMIDPYFWVMAGLYWLWRALVPGLGG